MEQSNDLSRLRPRTPGGTITPAGWRSIGVTGCIVLVIGALFWWPLVLYSWRYWFG